MKHPVPIRTFAELCRIDKSLDHALIQQESLTIGSDQPIVLWEERRAYCKGFARQELGGLRPSLEKLVIQEK